MAYEITGSGNLIGSTLNETPLSPRRSLVSVSFSLATAPRSPARTSATLVGVFPCSSVRWPNRSGVSLEMFCTVESAFTEPEMTRNIVMRPANGSATVFQTKTAAGELVRGLHRDAVLRSFGRGREGPLGRRRHVVQNRVEQRLHPDVRGRRRADQREDASGRHAALEALDELVLRQRSRLEELLHQRVIGFRDHLDERVARRLGRRLRGPRGSALPTPCRCRRPRTSSSSSRRDRRRRGNPFPHRSESGLG